MRGQVEDKRGIKTGALVLAIFKINLSLEQMSTSVQQILYISGSILHNCCSHIMLAGIN